MRLLVCDAPSVKGAARNEDVGVGGVQLFGAYAFLAAASPSYSAGNRVLAHAGSRVRSTRAVQKKAQQEKAPARVQELVLGWPRKIDGQ